MGHQTWKTAKIMPYNDDDDDLFCI
jgi:hypothetical protein